MKNLIKMVKGTDKLGYKLSAICGINWLVGQMFKWQSLVFEMIACAVLVKIKSEALDVSKKSAFSMKGEFMFTNK